MAVVVLGLDGIEGEVDGADGSTSTRIVYRSASSSPPGTVGDLAVTAAVVTATGINIGSQHPIDPRSFCRKVSSRCMTRRVVGVSQWEWVTTYEFTSKADAATDGGGSDPTEEGGGASPYSDERNPWNRPPKITFSARSIDEPVSVDIFNRKVENSAGDPIIRTRKNAKLMVRWERKMRTWDWTNNKPVYNGGFLYSRNQGSWKPAGKYSYLLGETSVEAGCAQMQSITSSVNFDSGGCVDVAVDIAIDDGEFIDRFLDQGYFYLTDVAVPAGQPPAVARRRFRSGDGVATGPQLLNGNGRPLANGAAAQYVNRQYYDLKNWSQSPWGPQSTAGRFFSLPSR
jgi:hypothetical protein